MLILYKCGFKIHAAKAGTDFFKIAELRGSILVTHFVLLLQKNKPEHFENAPVSWLIKVRRPFGVPENEKGRLLDGFGETNKQTPKRSYEILRRTHSVLRLQKGRFFGFRP